MAKINLEFYRDEVEYSDGAAIEDEILEIVRSGNFSDLENIENIKWPMFYHLSHLRENILNWYPFKENCTILEIGAGCGALTGLFCRRAKYVTSIELTEKRAIINYERHNKYENLEIFVGNFCNMKFQRKYDYIVVNGVLEYAGDFVESETPYKEFIGLLSPLLKEDGEILLAIENRIGLKYFSGAKEDHLGELFVGLNGYRSDSKVRTFSKSEITSLIESCDLSVKKFYYPYPDYKFPESIYSDEGFVKVPLSYDTNSYDTDRYMLFDEIRMQNVLIKEKAGGAFANSFLVVANKNGIKKEPLNEDILYIKVNANRDDKFKICTVIYSEGNQLKVKKRALTEAAITHLEQMERNYARYQKAAHGFSLLPVRMLHNELICDYLEAPTLETVLLDKIEDNDHEGYLSLLRKFYNSLASYGELQLNQYSDEFRAAFGQEKCTEHLEFSLFNNIDVLFDNVCTQNGQFILFDCEWYINCQLPIKFIFWRSVKEFYRKHISAGLHTSENELYRMFEISNNMIETFYHWEAAFSKNYVKMLDKSTFSKKTLYYDDVRDIFDKNSYVANLYVDTGKGFNDKERCQIAYNSDANLIKLQFDIGSFTNIRGIRFDPVEGQFCKCKVEDMQLDGKKLEFRAINTISVVSDYDVFLTLDPIYIVEGEVCDGSIIEIEYMIERIEEEQIHGFVTTENVAMAREIQELKVKNDEFMQKIQLVELDKEKLETENKAITNELQELMLKGEELDRDIQLQKTELANLRSEIKEKVDYITALSIERDVLSEDRAILAREYNILINSTIWRSTKPLRQIMDALKSGKRTLENYVRELNKLLMKTKQNIKTHGIKKTATKIVVKGPEVIGNIKDSGRVASLVQTEDIWNKIESWIDETPHQFIDIFHVPMGWNTPLFQRFQHLSLQAGNVGGISIYGAHPLVDKEIEVFEFISPTLCIVNLDNYEVKKKLFEILDRKPGLKIIRLQSIDLATTIDELKSFISKGYKILFEYIDEITPQITGNIPRFVLDRHEYVLSNETITVVATADKLYEQVKPYRNRNMAMITNGVDYGHWNVDRDTIDCPPDIKDIIGDGKIVIGYHGALAQWIDYNLLIRLAEDSRFALLLIGHEHDDSLARSGLLSFQNVHFIGSKPYSELSRYAAFYDIAILPFIVNDITKSVSPVKIFEYMALQKPIVTYALPECQKYKSCLVADTEQQFIDNIEKALNLRYDRSYLQLLKKEALENTWQSITQQTFDLVREHQTYTENANAAVINSVENQQNEGQISPVYVQDGRLYRTLKKIFWNLPIAPPKIKQKFLFHIKKTFKPSMLHYPPGESNGSGQAATSINNDSQITEISSEQLKYIDQILKIPDKNQDVFESITDKPYQRQIDDSKIIAYYLTQFHPDPHNEKWWGKGVTEWNNVCRAVPQFVGQYQPRLPGELGFYDLRLKENMARQIELAKMYGIYGFSFYYYWFDGERLLERPLEMFLADQSLDYPFSLCWANENWTKRFDGTNADILMEQPKSVDSYKQVIHDMARFFIDKRYITVQNKKMITVYRPSLMPDTEEVIQYWRDYCRNQGIGELYIIAVKENMVNMDWIGLGYDAISEFHPGTVYTNCKKVNSEITFIREDFTGEVFDYKDLVENQRYFNYDFPKLYRAVMPMWDNTARRNNKGMVFHGSTPELYKQWLKDVINEGQSRSDLEDNMVFINAWNEWGEGAYLEPDKKYGYAYLKATKEAVEESRRK